jgi:hypothetical protein
MRSAAPGEDVRIIGEAWAAFDDLDSELRQ